jgi:2-oxo-3-hexenedioate decarboxylase
VLLELDGRVAETGSSSAILGHPLRALEAADRLAARAGLTVQPGEVVLAGAATAAVPLPPGTHVRAVVNGLGSVSIRTEATA